MRLKLKNYTWGTALIVALAFLLSQASCSGPTVHVGQQNKDSLIVARIQELEYHTQVLEEKLRQKDTTEMLMWQYMVALDSNSTRALRGYQTITKKAIRKYNTAATVGGFADGLFGQKLSRFGKKIEEVSHGQSNR